jgi:deoxyribodipyrimidine photo-lyase
MTGQVPPRIPAPKSWPDSLSVSDLELEPRIDWAAGLRETWEPGEAGASRRMQAFLHGSVETYATERDRPDHQGTSHLSPYLHFGEISAREILRQARNKTGDATAEAYLRQLAWREFSYHLLFHFPQISEKPLHAEFRDFSWRVDERGLKAWTRGRTGYPFVDAGMRQLWQTGWMHNRVRMVVASFLVKHLMIPWREGAAWFWDTLVDADLANNTMGWQWAAGCGADAAPYFRVFNPVKQGQKFDPDGAYVRRWVPELSAIPSNWIHAPWETPPLVLAEAGITLGKDYPKPIVEHEAARARALAAFQNMRQRRATHNG